MSLPNWSKRIEVLATIYAAVLSTALGIREFHQYLRERPILRAECEAPVFVGIGDKPARLSYSIRVWNAGPRPITIFSALPSLSVLTGGSAEWSGKGEQGDNPELPVRLEEGDVVVFRRRMMLDQSDTSLVSGQEYRGVCGIFLRTTDGEKDLQHPISVFYAYFENLAP